MILIVRLAFCQLAIAGVAFAGPFNILARETSSTQPSNSSISITAPLTAASPNATLSSSSFSGNTTTGANVTVTSINSSSTPVSTASASAPTNDALAADAAKKCHRIRPRTEANNSNPFCFPTAEAKVYVGNTTYFVWDHTLFQDDDTNQIKLRYLDYVAKEDTISQVSADNKQGWAKIEMQKEWLEGNKSTNLTFFMSSTNNGDSDSSNTLSGPRLMLVDDKSEKEGDSQKSSKLGMGLGIPIAFAFVALGIVGLLFCMKKRRKGAGYLNKRSHSQGGGRSRAIHLEDDDWSGGTRGPERFRDEPGPGLELQDRSRGYDRDNSIGSLGSSPTNDGFENQGQVGGNAFRDEISRQRNKNR